MNFIKELQEDDQLSEIYLVKSVNKSVTISGKDFLTILFQDKTGTIYGKKWSVTEQDLEVFKPGKFVKVTFSVTSYKNKLELNISDGMQVKVIKFDDYIVSSPRKKEELEEVLLGFINSIEDKNIKLIVNELYENNKEKFLTYPAASSVHHSFCSGLLYHTVSMLEVAKDLITHYKDLDKDLVYAGIFGHDIGKTVELSGIMPIEYTFEGDMLGHLVIGQNMVHDVAVKHGIDKEEKVILLEHIILSSHGKLEFGSPVTGHIKEAILVNFIDDLDARMMIFDNNLADLKEGELSKPIQFLDNRRIYKKKNK